MTVLSRLLVIDVGNSQTKLGGFIDGELAFEESFATEPSGIEALQHSVDAVPITLDGVVMACVVPDMKPVIDRVVHEHLGLSTGQRIWLSEHSSAVCSGLGVDIQHYQSGVLGDDRLANLLAAKVLYPGKNVLVVDVGTTTTFEMLDDSGLFIGGAICPGPRQFQSLVGQAAQLFEVDVFKTPAQTPAMTTEASLENGLYYGYKGAMLEIIGNLFQSAGWPLSQVTIVFTGGAGRPVRDMLKFEIPEAHIDPSLTLRGLYHAFKACQPITL